MRIGIDIRCLGEGKMSGVEQYAISMLTTLFEQDSINEYILFYNSYSQNKKNFDWAERFANVSVVVFRFPNKLFNLSLWFLGRPRIDKLLGGVDLFFAPNISFFGLSKDCKKLLTVHDLSFERFPEYFSFKRKLWHFLINPRRLCHSFDHIITVSQSSRADLVSLYALGDEKISVLLPQLDLDSIQKRLSPEEIIKIKNKYGIGSGYLLYFGTIEPRKNIISVIEAYEKYREENNVFLQLVIAGARGWQDKDVFLKIERSIFREDIVVTGFVEEQDKAGIYQAASVLIYPSFFEGYGFPPLEAMASGIPVIASNCSSLPEVTGDAALLVDPYRPYEIVVALQILQDQQVREHYVQAGKKRVEELATKIKFKKSELLDLISALVKS